VGVRSVSTVFAAIWLVVQASSSPNVLASGAVEGSMVALRGLLPAASMRFETSQGINDRLAAGDAPDVLIAQTAIVDRLVRENRADADSRVVLGRMPIGVAVASGAPAIDVATEAALKRAIVDAKAIVISQGASGAVLERIFQQMGIADQIQSRVLREPRGDDVMKRVATSGAGAIGFTMVSEIHYGERHGARLVAPLPQSIQTYTPYDAIVMRSARASDAARAFVRALETVKAKEILAANGWIR
jgi:molybdate transport system substrate-binding protein